MNKEDEKCFRSCETTRRSSGLEEENATSEDSYDTESSSTEEAEPKNSVQYLMAYIEEGKNAIEAAKVKLTEFLAISSIDYHKKCAKTEFEDYELTVEFYIKRAERNLSKLKNYKYTAEDHLLKIEDFPAPFSEETLSKMGKSQLLNRFDEIFEEIGRGIVPSTLDESLDWNELQNFDYSPRAPLLSPWSTLKCPSLHVIDFLISLNYEVETFKSVREEKMKSATLENWDDSSASEYSIQQLMIDIESYKSQWLENLENLVDCNGVKLTEAKIEEHVKEADVLTRNMILREFKIDQDTYEHYLLEAQKSLASLSEVTCSEREGAEELQSQEEMADEEEDLGLFFMGFDTTY